MRSESEMLGLIINAANQEERIRAVILNGSRAANPLRKDCFQDYDIVYFVNDFQFFVNTHTWIDIFGKRIILEMPAYKDFEPSQYNGHFNYQMLLTDGNRIDLTFAALETVDTVIVNDPVATILLDKDGMLRSKTFSGAEVYWVPPPTKRAFENSCNSFWWVLQNVAKGIKRCELPYAINMLNFARDEVDQVVSWYIGLNNEFRVSPGKFGKYFEKYLGANLWNSYVSTFPSGNYEDIWKSLFRACDLFRLIAIEIANRYSYCYPYTDDASMTAYLYQVQNMPDSSISEAHKECSIRIE